MMTSLLLGAALTAPGAPIPSSADPAPTGPAPWVLYLKADDSGRAQVMIYKTQKVTQNRTVAEMVDGKAVNKIVQEQVERMLTSYVLVDSMNPKFTTAAGLALSTGSVMKRAKAGVVVLVSADGKPISKSWLRAVDSEAILVAADGLVSEAAPRGMGVIPTAAPRLVLLNTDMQGKVQVAYNPNSTTNNGMYYGRGGGRLVFMGNGQQVFMDDGGYYNPNPTPQNTEAPIKPLDQIAFEAYDLNGKAVTKEAALKRLTAGGYALIAGDNRVPDESYLQQFRGDLLILVSSELINIPTGKKGGGGTATPAIAPLVRPGLMVKPAAIQAVPLKVVPVLKAAPAPVLEKEALPAPVAEKK